MTVFNSPGPANTAETISLAVTRARELGIEKIVIASHGGDSARKFAQSWPPGHLIVIRHVCGFDEPNVQDMPPEIEKALIGRGVRIITAAHVMGGIGRGIRRKFNTYQVDEIIASTLRLFGQGVKVCVEISLMAADAGYVRTDEKIVACGGTGQGLDSACVITPSPTHNFFDLKVNEVICKPVLG